MLTLASTSFSNNEVIPQKYTCHGENISPELHWSSDIKNIGCYVLILDDPDAQKVVGKAFVHWIAYLPARITALPEGVSGKTGSGLIGLNPATYEARNDFGKTVYGGPCPPASSGEHAYRFTLFAMTESLEGIITSDKLKAPFTAEVFQSSMAHSILGEARLVGTFKVPTN